MVRIQTSNFNIEEEIRLVKKQSQNIGGIVTFLGTVREFSNGKQIQRMTLECYPEMAEKNLFTLRKKVLSHFDIIEVTIIHRVGKLDIGDNIVLIIVASQHRKNAFDACRFCIDELKKTVPLWKTEKSFSQAET